MRHYPKTSLLPGSSALVLKGDDDDPENIVTKAISDLTATVNDRLKEVEKKADTTKIVERLDKLEAKMNRPKGDDDKKADEPSVERKAFAAYLRLGDAISEEDRKALTQSSNPDGGYLSPPELSTEFIRDLLEFSPIRSVASVRGTTAPSTIYPTRGDRTNAKWVGETQPREASTITFGQKEIAVKELATFVDINNRLLGDAPQAESEVRLALAEDFGKKEGAAFVNGTGAGQPEGLMTHTGIAEWVNGSTTAVSPDAMVKMMYNLPAAYRNSGTWMMNGTTLGVIRTLKDGDGRFLWQPSFQAGQPETILGRPVIEAVDMPDIGAGKFPILYGDFSAYRIVDRLAMSILVNPYLLATKGLTRIHATRRVGGRVLQAERFRKLKMSTS